MKGNGPVFNTLTLMIHADDHSDILVYNSLIFKHLFELIFKHLFEQTIVGAGTCNFRIVKGIGPVFSTMTLMVHACGDITVYNSLIFTRLFGQNVISTGAGDVSKLSNSMFFPYRKDTICLKDVCAKGPHGSFSDAASSLIK